MANKNRYYVHNTILEGGYRLLKFAHVILSTKLTLNIRERK